MPAISPAELEEVADAIADAVGEHTELEVPIEPTLDLRTGGLFFDARTADGRAVTVLVYDPGA